MLTEGARCGQTTAQRLQVKGKPGAADLQGELGVAQWRACSRAGWTSAADSGRPAMKPHRFALRDGCAGGPVGRPGGMGRTGAGGMGDGYSFIDSGS